MLSFNLTGKFAPQTKVMSGMSSLLVLATLAWLLPETLSKLVSDGQHGD
jgi:hypothetical protein